jgi:hypothetical protein
MQTFVKALFVGYTITMKTPDQNNLPKNKQEAEKKLKQQPKIPRKVLDEIFAGVSSLPALRVIGEKLNPPKIDNSKSNEMQQKSDQLSSDYDALIEKNTNLAQLHKKVQGRDYEAKVFDLESSAGNLEYTKEFHAKAASEQIQTQKQAELEKFEKQNPEHVEKQVQNETKKNLKSLNDQYKQAQDDVQREIIKSQIDVVNKSNSMQMDKLAKYRADKEKQKIEEKTKSKVEKSALKSQSEINKIDEKNERAKDQQRLDDSIKTQFEATMAHNAEVTRRAKNIKSIRKERIGNEKLDAQIEKDDQKAAMKEKEIASDKKERQKRLKGLGKEILAKEAKWDQEMEAKKDHVSILDKLKKSVSSGMDKARAKIKENDEAKLNPKPKEKVQGPRQANVIDKMKAASKKGFDVVKAKIKENDEAKLNPKSKEKKSKLELGNILAKTNVGVKEKKEYNPINQNRVFNAGPSGVEVTVTKKQSGASKSIEKMKSGIKSTFEKAKNKIKEGKDKLTSPEMLAIQNSIKADKLDLKTLEALVKESKATLKSTDDVDFKYLLQRELDENSARIDIIKDKISKSSKMLEIRANIDDTNFDFSTGEEQQRIESVNIATNQLERLYGELSTKTQKIDSKIKNLKSKKSPDQKAIDKLQKDKQKIAGDLNKKIEIQKSIIQENK